MFDPRGLRTVHGEEVEVLRPGEHNRDAGPDFFDARIRIGGTLWVGNVEIHVRSREWWDHGHQHDPAYNNVILHVVADHDRPAVTQAGRELPVVALQGRISPEVLNAYRKMVLNERWIPCGDGPSKVSQPLLRHWLDRLMVERLERKAEPMRRVLEWNKNDWERTFWMFLGRNFGFKVNAEPFESLVRSVPFRFIHGTHLSLFQAEALLFGLAGFLENPGRYGEAYPVALSREFGFLRKKYALTPMAMERWKFARTRPNNFPPLRIAQFASLFRKGASLFSRILLTRDIGELRGLLKAIPGDYWKNHFKFGSESKGVSCEPGKGTRDNLLINTVAPLLFLYGIKREKPALRERALEILESLPPESNRVIKKWRAVGVAAKSALDSQALLELKREYCEKVRCLQCPIGCSLLRNAQTHDTKDR